MGKGTVHGERVAMAARPSTALVERGGVYRNCTVRLAVECLCGFVIPGVTPEGWITPSTRRLGAITTMVRCVCDPVKPASGVIGC